MRMKAALTAASLLLAGTLLGAPTATATTTVPAPAPSLSPLVGLSGDGPMLSESDADLGRDLDAVKASGAGWVRVGVDWSAVEQTQGTLDWSNPDRQVNAAAARGLKVLGITTYTPSWAQAPGVAPGDTHGRPASATVFGTFAGQAAQHYAGRIDTWEMWNEPNLGQFFTPQVDAGFYATMLASAYTAVRKAVPGATVLNGGLAPAGDNPTAPSGQNSLSPVTFTRQMYAHGARNSMDALALHPYTYPELLSVPNTADWAPYTWVRTVRELMVANGDSGKKIWFTEFGAPVATIDWGGTPVQIDERKQADIIADGFTAARAMPYVGPVFIYSIRDQHTGTTDREDNFGLLHTDFTPKPAFTAVRNQTTKDVAAPPIVAPPTPTPEMHGAIAEHYNNTPGLAALFGPTTTPELTTPDTVGRYNHFTGGNGGSIYWTPNTGAFSVHGAIRGHWESLGWEAGPTGYPLTDERTTPDGVGRYNHFTGGDGASVYWTPATGAQLVHGAIRDRWASMGWELSSLGYPVSDEYAVPGGRRSNFQHGSITYRFSDGAVLIG